METIIDLSKFSAEEQLLIQPACRWLNTDIGRDLIDYNDYFLGALKTFIGETQQFPIELRNRLIKQILPYL